MVQNTFSEGFTCSLVVTICVNRYIPLIVEVNTREKSTLLQHFKKIKKKKPYIHITRHLLLNIIIMIFYSSF